MQMAFKSFVNMYLIIPRVGRIKKKSVREKIFWEDNKMGKVKISFSWEVIFNYLHQENFNKFN